MDVDGNKHPVRISLAVSGASFTRPPMFTGRHTKEVLRVILQLILATPVCWQMLSSNVLPRWERIS